MAHGYPGPSYRPQPIGLPPGKPPMIGWDVAISTVALVLAVLVGVTYLLFGFFLLAFIDYCPPETCSTEDAFTAVAVGFVAALAVAVVGTVVTIVRIIRRRISWPFAVGALVPCTGVCVAGIAGYFAAVGAAA